MELGTEDNKLKGGEKGIFYLGVMIRRWLMFLAALALMWSCGSRSSKKEGSAEPVPMQVKRGTLTVGIANTLSSYYLFRGYPRGFEYDLLRLFCDDQGWELELEVITDLDDLLESVEKGKVDLAAGNLAMMGQRLKRVQFAPAILTIKQVLVQRSKGTEGAPFVSDPLELEGKTLYVLKGSSHEARIKRFMQDNGIHINLELAEEGVGVDRLIEGVARGEWDYTVADDNIAYLHTGYFRNLNTEVQLSLSQRVGWALNLTNDSLTNKIEDWWRANRKKQAVQVVFNKYFKQSGRGYRNFRNDFEEIAGGKVSAYDDLLRNFSSSLGWDWRLLAALVNQESQFNPLALSPFGAVGLMQVLPATAMRFGVDSASLFDAQYNVKAGTRYLEYLQGYWRGKLTDTSDIQQFILASYNVGLGHVRDAQRLAEKYGMNHEQWEGEVEVMLLRKSQPKYYRDPVVEHGYCRGYQPVDYVAGIFDAYRHYQELVPE